MLWETLFLIFYAFVACFLLAGVRRKLRARIQGRIGPPILQPLYDFLKLLVKETSMPRGASRLYVYAPILALALALTATVMIPVPGISPLSFAGDLIVVLILLTSATAFLLLGGLASSNPYSGVAGSRGLLLVLTLELPLALIVASIYMATGKLNIEQIATSMATDKISSICLAPSLVAFLVYIVAKTWTTPFSLPNAETEIMEGPFVEYSGGLLALVELTHFLEQYALVGLLSNMLTYIIFGQSDFAYSVVLYSTLLVLVVVLVTLVETIFARLRLDQALKILFILPNLLALTSIALVGVRWLT